MMVAGIPYDGGWDSSDDEDMGHYSTARVSPGPKSSAPTVSKPLPGRTVRVQLNCIHLKLHSSAQHVRVQLNCIHLSI
jgi:hypothetical protein